MEYSIAFVVFAAVLWGMIFLVQKFLERVDPSVEKMDITDEGDNVKITGVDVSLSSRSA